MRAKKENGNRDRGERLNRSTTRKSIKRGRRGERERERKRKRRKKDETRENVERATNEVVQSSYQRLATKRSISSNRRGRNYRYNSYYWVPRHVKIENERRTDEIDIHRTHIHSLSLSLSLPSLGVFSLFDY